MSDVVAQLQENALRDPWAKPGSAGLTHFTSIAPGVRVGLTLNH